jgi:hypothetical protein
MEWRSGLINYWAAIKLQLQLQRLRAHEDQTGRRGEAQIAAKTKPKRRDGFDPRPLALGDLEALLGSH